MKEIKFLNDILNKKTNSNGSISKIKKNTTLNVINRYIDFSESYNGKVCEINFDNNKTITYSYQRHDLQVNCDNWLKFLYDIDDTNSNGMFFSCCMASISTLLMILNKEGYKKAIFSNLPYFESFDFCEELFKTVKEYKYIKKNEKADFLWLCSASPKLFSIDYTIVNTSCIILDTSCLAPTDEYIINLYDYCKKNNKTLILVRSHMKLDCFGLEINRLGSLLIFNDKNDIINKAKKLQIALGNNTTLNNIYPWLGVENFFNITKNNVLKVQRMMADVKKYLVKELDINKYEVCSFDHNLYLTIKIKNKVDNLDELNKNVSSYCQKYKLPVLTASSFYLENIGIDNFVRRLDNNSQFLRISLSAWISKKSTMESIKKIVEYLNSI